MSVIEHHPNLAELETRAGASDEDRAAWLAERAQGITATEIRDLIVKGPAFRRILIETKLGIRDESFLANQYTAWGNKREPVIAAWIEESYGIRPEHRVFRAADNPRYLASPDGVGVDFDGSILVSEIKTSGHDIAPGSKKYLEVGYRIQKMWSMRVTGARKCLYSWERHDGDWQDRGGEFLEPAPIVGRPEAMWIEYDEDLAAELEEVARLFLIDLDEARADLEAGDYRPEVDEEIDTLAVNVLTFRGAESEAKAAKERTWAELKDLLAGRDAFTQESVLARVTWSPGEPSTAPEFDVEAAKQADPALFAEVQDLSKRWNEHQAKFTRTVSVPAKPTLTVTSVRQKATKP